MFKNYYNLLFNYLYRQHLHFFSVVVTFSINILRNCFLWFCKLLKRSNNKKKGSGLEDNNTKQRSTWIDKSIFIINWFPTKVIIHIQFLCKKKITYGHAELWHKRSYFHIVFLFECSVISLVILHENHQDQKQVCLFALLFSVFFLIF